MNSSGIRRGLAVAATSALAVAGLALSPASAQTIDVTQDTQPATLYTPSIGSFSTKVDGNGNTTVTLLATAGKTVGGQTVNTIRFWYPANPALLDVHVPVVGGVASYQWAAPANVGNITVTAQAEAAGNLALGAPDTQVVSTTNPNAMQSISIAGANRDKLGLYYDGAVWNGAVTGKTGAAIGATDVKVAGPGTASNAAETLTSGADSNGLIGYLATFTVNPDNLHSVSVGDNGTPTDDLVITAANGDDSDGRVFSAYRQVLTQNNATATVRAGSHQNVAGDVGDSYNPVPDGNPNNDRTFWNLKVVDQFGAPVVGVDMYEANSAGTALGLFTPPFFGGVGNIVTNFTTGAGTANSGSTQADGVVQARIDEGTMDTAFDQDPTAGVQATYYVVDVDRRPGHAGVFDNGTDYLLKVTQSNLPQSPASIEAVNSKGLFMDDDEGSTLTVTVKDANGDPISNVGVTVNQHRDNKTAGTTADNILGFGNTDANGQFQVGFFCANDNHDVWTEKITTNNGVSQTIVIECDRSQVLWKPQHLQGAVGSQVEAKGILRLPSGGTLEGRTLALNLTPGTGSPADARFPTTGQPTGTVAGTGTTATATTQSGGKFSVYLKDGATTGQELNDQIAATSPGLGIISDYPCIQPNVNPACYPNNVAIVDFLRSFTVNKVEIRNYSNGNLDSLWSPFPAPAGTNDNLQPGKLGVGNVVAYNPDGAKLYNTDVPVTINEGNFINLANRFDPAAVVGGKVGEWSNAGKSITVNTGDLAAGGPFAINIERNTGFDDDGLVADKVIAGTGTASFEHDFNWNTKGIPLNSGSYTVELAPTAEQESTILPKARAGNSEPWSFDGTGQQVFYNVVATDQFGNRTQQPLTVSDDSPVAGFVSGTSFKTQYTLDPYAITAYSKSAANQSLEVELDNQTTTVYNDNPYNSAFDPSDPITVWTNFFDQPSADIQKNTAPINWYDLVYVPSNFTLTHLGESTVPAGTQVTNVLTATDQEGQLIENVPVGFLRTGPSDDGDTDGNVTDWTNEDGEAFYDWAGNMAGLADVTAVIYNDEGARQFTVGPDKVTFSGEIKEAINLVVKGSSSGNTDIVKARADSNANGAMAVVKRAGEVIRSHRLDENGDWNFRITDHNGNKVTKYRVIVAETASTREDSGRIGIK